MVQLNLIDKKKRVNLLTLFFVNQQIDFSL